MTKAEIQALIDSNLASASTITAVKHREVETALLNFIDDFATSRPLAKGTVNIGDVYGTSIVSVTFATALSTSSYIVTGSLVSKLTGPNQDDDVFWVVRNKSTTGFQLIVREIANETQNVEFDYVIFAK